MIGATITAVGTPASESARSASSRVGGVAARGSILRAIRRSSVVTDSADAAEICARHPREDVDVADDERRLGDDADRMPRPLQHLEDRPRDPPLALDRLVGIGIGAERDQLRLIARIGELARQEFGRVGLGVELGLEVETGRVGPDSSASGARSSRCSRARSRGTG